MLRAVNRLLLGLAGLVLVCAGGAVLAAGAGLSVPSWWPYDGRHDVLLSDADRARWRDEGWWWPVVIGALALLLVLGLWWFLAQLRRSRLAEVLVESGDGEGALLRGRALEGVLRDEAASMEGVSRAAVTLTGRRNEPRARVALQLEPDAAPGGTLTRLVDEAVAHARDSAGLDALPADVRLGVAGHRARRVS
ncbi:alkaline shock response membrane anchor protein AmaP [Streptomyces sp. NPDC003023]|uniref:alkaline shock response membrane anchor protein AmaP n=1 Tax=Streptomyces sp. NPDC003023 TaxID=3364675 RepID=UPI0036817164